MNKFKGILVLGTAANVFCGCCGSDAKFSEITIDGWTDCTENIKNDKKKIDYINTSFNAKKEDFGVNIKVFTAKVDEDDLFIVVGTPSIYSNQDEAVKKTCVKLDGSDCYLHVLGFDENTMKNVKITKDDKTKGKYKVVLPNLPWREGSEFDEE